MVPSAAPQLDRRAFLAAAAGFGAALALPVLPAHAVLRDDTDALEQAIANAADGVVRLPAGVLRVRRTLTIDRPVSIVGAGIGRTVIRHAGAGRPRNTLVISAPGVEMRDLTIEAEAARQHSGVYGLLVRAPRFTGERVQVRGNGGVILSRSAGSAWRSSPSPVWVYRSPRCVIEDCAVTGSRRNRMLALVSHGSRGTVVRGNSFANRVDADYTAPAIDVAHSAGCVIEGNVIAGSNWHGIRATSAPGIQVRDNEVRRPGRLRADGGPTVSAILLDRAAGSRVERNRTFDTGGYGIAVCRSRATAASPVVVTENSVDGCEDPGITVQASEHVAVTRNAVHSATWGFTVGEADRPCRSVHVTDNEFSACPWAGGFVQGSDRCSVRRNTFVDCGDRDDVKRRPDALVVLFDGGGRGTTLSRVELNTATQTPEAAALGRRLPALFVRSDPGNPYPGPRSARNVVAGNAIVPPQPSSSRSLRSAR